MINLIKMVLITKLNKVVKTGKTLMNPITQNGLLFKFVTVDINFIFENESLIKV